jgi:hypothetical protein
MLAGAPEEYQRHIREKYSGKVGVAQLARNISKLASGDWQSEARDLGGVESVFPVMIAYDDRLDAPLHPRFLAIEFAKQLYAEDALRHVRVGKWSIAPLTTMTIGNLEVLEGSMRDFGLFDLLKDYSRECADRFVSLHNFMASFPKYPRHLLESARVRSAFSAELRSLEEMLKNPEPGAGEVASEETQDVGEHSNTSSRQGQ